MIEYFNKHLYVNRIHFVAKCPKCQADLAKIETIETNSAEGQSKQMGI